MKLSQLLLQRQALARQSRLANLAYAYSQLDQLVRRVAAARLHGPVCLQPADPAAERYWPVLTALAGSQAVIEEHFTDENILELSDVAGYLTGEDDTDTTFRLEAMAGKFLRPLQQLLEQEGVEFEPAAPRLRATGRDGG